MTRYRPRLAAVMIGWLQVAVQAAAAPAERGHAEALLHQLVTTGGTHCFRATVNLNGESTVTVSRRKGWQQRQEILSPPELAGDVVIDNGTLRWHVSPQAARADVTPTEHLPMTPAARLSMIRRNYHIADLGPATVAGHSTRILALKPTSHAGIEHRLFIDAKGLPLRTERWRDRRLVEYSAFTGIERQSQMPAHLFAPALPAGTKLQPAIHVLASGHDTERVIAKLAFHPRLPDRLPNGFQVVAVRVYSPRDTSDPTVHWQLSDGMIGLSVFCRQATPWKLPTGSRAVPLANGIQGARIDDGMETMLLWQTGGVRYSLVGVASDAELIATARETILHPRLR